MFSVKIELWNLHDNVDTSEVDTRTGYLVLHPESIEQ